MRSSHNNRNMYPHLNFNIKYLELPNKIYETFVSEGKVLASDICTLKQDDILEIKGVGITAAKKAIDIFEEHFYLEEIDDDVKDVILEISNIDYINKDKILININKILIRNVVIDKSNFISLIYQNKKILSVFYDYLLKQIRKKEIIIPRIEKYFPNHLKGTIYINRILEDLLKQGNIEIYQNTIFPKYMTAIEYAKTISNERDKEILLSRFNGKTLEEIGKQYELSRERIRQILGKHLDKSARLYEDKYKYLYRNYLINKEDFIIAFDEKSSSYNYLNSRYTMGKKNIKKALLDEKLNYNMKKSIEKAVYKNHIILDNEKIKLNKDSILKYIIKKYASDEIVIDELILRYNEVFEDEMLKDFKKQYIFSNKVFFNKVINLNYILYSMGRKLRYYEIHSRNYKHLIESLKLEEYTNLKLSTMKLFNENEELMKKYDIRNGYELHNLLKKILKTKEYNKIIFSRMPYLKIGEVD